MQNQGKQKKKRKEKEKERFWYVQTKCKFLHDILFDQGK